MHLLNSFFLTLKQNKAKNTCNKRKLKSRQMGKQNTTCYLRSCFHELPLEHVRWAWLHVTKIRKMQFYCLLSWCTWFKCATSVGISSFCMKRNLKHEFKGWHGGVSDIQLSAFKREWDISWGMEGRNNFHSFHSLPWCEDTTPNSSIQAWKSFWEPVSLNPLPPSSSASSFLTTCYSAWWGVAVCFL